MLIEAGWQFGSSRGAMIRRGGRWKFLRLNHPELLERAFPFDVSESWRAGRRQPPGSGANANVYAGRRLHDEVVSEEDETPEQRSVEVASEQWGIQGKVDAVQWMTAGGRFIAGTTASPGRAAAGARRHGVASDIALGDPAHRQHQPQLR